MFRSGEDVKELDDRFYLEAVSKPLFIFGESETGCDVCPGRSTEALVNHTECDEDAEREAGVGYQLSGTTSVFASSYLIGENMTFSSFSPSQCRSSLRARFKLS